MKQLIVIETPKGSREKYHFDTEISQFKLKKLLPLGMIFPYDFGFIPGTHGADGDPLDAMVISEFDSFPGCRIECRLIGALLASQSEKQKKIRNDRFFFIPEDSVLFAHIRSITQFSKKHNDQLRDFFINYNKAEDKIFNPIRFISAEQARALVIPGSS